MRIMCIALFTNGHIVRINDYYTSNCRNGQGLLVWRDDLIQYTEVERNERELDAAYYLYSKRPQMPAQRPRRRGRFFYITVLTYGFCAAVPLHRRLLMKHVAG